MKKIQTITIGSVIVIGLVLSGIAFATEWGDKPHRRFAKNRQHRNTGVSLLAKFQYENLTVKTLSEISGQSVDAISEKLKEQRMHQVLKDSGVDRDAFRKAMRTKVNDLVKQAASSGSITPEQEKAILEKMERRVRRHELMTRLIEKGIEDGTITPEEARTLSRKPF